MWRDVEEGASGLEAFNLLLRRLMTHFDRVDTGEGYTRLHSFGVCTGLAHKVGQRHCSHAAEPQPLGDMRHAARKKAATEHPGLCGVYHAHIIAAVTM